MSQNVLSPQNQVSNPAIADTVLYGQEETLSTRYPFSSRVKKVVYGLSSTNFVNSALDHMASTGSISRGLIAGGARSAIKIAKSTPSLRSRSRE